MSTRQIIYSTTKVTNAGGRAVKNPRLFRAPVDGATKVFLNGSWPKVRGAYEQAGVPVADIADMRAAPKAKKEEPAEAPASE